MATPFKKYGHLTLKKSSVQEKKRRALKRALGLSFLVIIGALIWVTLFLIKDPGAIKEAWKVIFSLPSLFLIFLAIIIAIIMHLITKINTWLRDEIIVFSLLFIMAGIAEIWSTGMERPTFLPVVIGSAYLTTKIWISFAKKSE